MEKLSALRRELAARGLDGFVVPRTDEYQGEYVPASAERLAWLTGFTGSAGGAVILKDKAVAMSDGRYTAQLSLQVDQKIFELADSGATSPGQWLAEKAGKQVKIGYDPRLHTAQEITAWQKHLKASGVEMVPLADNPLDAVWSDRPAAPASAVEIFPDRIAGHSAAEKREIVAAALRQENGVGVVIPLPESVAWLLNIRGQDVPHNPVALSQAIVRANGDVDWFIAGSRVSPAVRTHLGHQVRVREPADLAPALRDLAQEAKAAGKPVLLDAKRTPVWFKHVLEEGGARIEDSEDPCLLPRACKTAAEQKAIVEAHVRDGAAVVNFLCWLDQDASKGKLTELDVVAKLRTFREAVAGFRDDSFDTIAGWAGNGAIIHYRADAKSNKAIMPPGILLVDSGGQYLEGTTDITRTITVGAPTAEMQENYTRVLQGHIAVASACFEEGTVGAAIDGLARAALGKARLGYSHGTGHGVGCYLSVHEQAATISKTGTVPFKVGMLISNEPGFYKKDAYGIRLENLVLVKDAGVRGDTRGAAREIKMMNFETVTLAPFDRRLIRAEMMTADELAWLNNYHERVFKTLSPLVDAAVKAWLKQATQPL